MRGLWLVPVLLLALGSAPALARRATPPGFAEPGDIIAAEGNFIHLSTAKGLKAAIHATAAPDAEIFAPQLMRVNDYANSAAVVNFPPWHTGQVWMSCDGSVAVTHGIWQQGPASGWYITVWKRQKDAGYKWLLEQGGPATLQSTDSDMIAAGVADCPVRHARAGEAPAPDRGKAPAADYTSGDYASGRSDDATLTWATSLGADGRTFTLHIKQDGVLHEVLRAAAAPGT